MADVFISYSKQDHTEARLLAAFLEAEGYSVWWDTQLEVGERYRQTIMQELGRARAVIVIWTESSVQSDWVMSEAGRALNDRKLIPVKAKAVAYKDIPPPFDNMHIVDVNDRETIRDAVVTKLAEPEAKPGALSAFAKKARFELLSWFGILGAALTLAANLQGMITLTKWIRSLFDVWVVALTTVWGYVLFFVPRVSPEAALLLTIATFSAINLILCSQRNSRLKKGHWLPVSLAIVIVFLIFASGFRSIDPEFWAIHETPPELHEFVELIWGPLPTWLLPIQLMFFLMLGLILFPVIPIYVAYVIARKYFGVRLSLDALSRRLWRINVAVLLLIAVNYLSLWVEHQFWGAQLMK